ncbi:kinase domain protein (macronuclear) [Tetrahymena thermophila SB210]|uniref:Kinase domain protein n=1 Tax=Tetrahymena thermophila (strain SB210) TaxID=312017 RepID=Q24CS8_TETTS|nr:kinase domain protein [Tetrahymena thermophila SB210]EAS05584.2 kinase domain protein [Tetrahymena thermophila SB210]|eukprot:XP_001025829.2 kinase domain protein [Tetrahymena thermophila SB210]
MGQQLFSNQAKNQDKNLIKKQEQDSIKELLNQYNYEYIALQGIKQSSQVIIAFSQKLQCNVAIEIFKILNTQKNGINLQELNQQITSNQQFRNEKYAMCIIELIYDRKQGLLGIVTELFDSDLITILDLNVLNIDQIIAMTYQLIKGILLISENVIKSSYISSDSIVFSKSKNCFLIVDHEAKVNLITQPVKVESKETDSVQNSVFSIGLLVTETLIQRRLTSIEQMYLKHQNIFEVLPSLKNSKHFEFISKILYQMLQSARNKMFHLQALLQIIDEFDIDENSLKSMKLKNKNAKLIINTISDIIKATNYYDELELNLHSFKTEQATSIAQNLEKCQNVTTFDINLGWIYITIEGATDILKILQKCQKIISLGLNLRGNRLGAEGVKIIGEGLQMCQNLSSLNISLNSNNLDAEGAKQLGVSLEKCLNITYLNIDLSNNKLGVEGAQYIGFSLKKCQNIKYLNLNLKWNFIEVEGAQSIEMSLQNCQNITFLYLTFGLDKQRSNVLEQSLRKKIIHCVQLIIYC